MLETCTLRKEKKTAPALTNSHFSWREGQVKRQFQQRKWLAAWSSGSQSVDQQHQYHLLACWKCKISHPRPKELVTLRVGQRSLVLKASQVILMHDQAWDPLAYSTEVNNAGSRGTQLSLNTTVLPYCLCDLGQVTLHLYASLFLCIESGWKSQNSLED